ncbi:hypothetical protein ABPG77_005832 [Micractinium sp. CCAP 211/92]
MGAHITGYLHAAAAATAGSAGPAPPLFICEGRTTTAADASRRVGALAAALTQRLGMQAGDRVCLAALATDHCLEVLLAVTAAGGIAAPLNWRWGAAEAAGAVQLVGARLLAADAGCLPFALAAAAAAPRGTLARLLLLGAPSSFRQADLAVAQGLGLVPAFAETLVRDCWGPGLALRCAPGGTALIVYTSGTTGKPKGVALSHAALHSQSMAKLLTCGYSRSDVYLHAAPLFHIGGLSSALAMLAAGARHVFLPRFDGAALLAAIQEHGVTSFSAVPAMVADLLAAASAAGTSALPSVARILVGGGGMPPALQRGLAALCPAATVHTAYGMTEGASSLTFHTLWGPAVGGSAAAPDGTQVAASSPAEPSGEERQQGGPAGGVYVGRPPPGIELAVYQPPAGELQPLTEASGHGSGGGSSGGRILLSGEGEIVMRGPHVMLGYWDDEEATAAAQLPGGWLRTGDLGCLRQGELWLLGRAKDMIKSGGENVHAWEVERALADHPGIALAAVVGAADWRLGEAVAAAVVLRPGWRWAGERCQVLLSRAGSAAAAAAVGPPTHGRRGGSGGSGGSGTAGLPGEQPEHGRQAAGGAVRVAEELRSTLLQPLQRRPSSAQGLLSPAASSGLDGIMAAPPEQEADQEPCHMQQVQAVAAGLQQVAAAAEAAVECRAASTDAACSRGDSGNSSGGSQAAPGGDSRLVDGRELQQHCRASGLAGFKLPRVFLHCDAASADAAPAGSGRAVLPVNSTGKVVKHLLRQAVQQHMAAAAGTTHGAGGGGPRSRL